MASIEHTIDTDTNTHHVFIAWDSGECVRYSVDGDGSIWMTGYGMEETHAIQNEYEIGEYLHADCGDFESVDDAVQFIIESNVGD